jgi:predicted metalloprotease with PDZ domain
MKIKMFLKSKVLLPVVCGTAIIGGRGFSQSSRVPPIAHYTVSMTFTQPLTAHISAILNGGEKLSMYPFGDDTLEDGWATYVRNLAMRDDSGRRIEFKTSGRAQWQILESVGRIRLEYDVDLSRAARELPEGNLRYAKFDGQSIFLTNRLLFIDTAGPGERIVDFAVPADWTVSSPLRQVAHRRFVAQDNRDLVFNTTVLGHYTELEVNDSGFTLLLVLPRELQNARILIQEPLRQITHSYVKLFPGTPHETYLMTVLQGSTDDGESYYRSSAFTSSGPILANNIILWGTFIAHELFHHWNGQQMKGKDVADRQWFSEGFTEYFANKTLVQNHLIADDLFIRTMETHLGLYSYFKVGSPFQGTSILDAGKRKGYNRFGVYDGGWAVAFCLDMDIRKATHRVRSIDDFMRTMYERFGSSEVGYTLDDIAAVATESAGKDEVVFFERYVRGVDVLPIKTCLGAAGLEGFAKMYAGEFYISPLKHPQAEELAIRDALFHRTYKGKARSHN